MITLKFLKPVTLLTLMGSLVFSGCKKEEVCDYRLGPWSAWNNGVRTRTVTASPGGCTGTPPTAAEHHACNSTDQGWLRLINYSPHAYQVTVTGPTTVPAFVMSGGVMKDSILVEVGSYALHAVHGGSTPAEHNTTLTVARCNKVTWSFP